MLYSSKLLFGGDKTQNIDALVQKSGIEVVMKEFDGFNRNIIPEEDVKKNTQLLEHIRQGFGLADNVIYVDIDPGIDVLKNVIYFTLNVNHRVDIL